MTRFHAWYDAVREPWRFLLFLAVGGPLCASDSLLGWSLVLLLLLSRGWWIVYGRRRRHP